MVNTNKTAALRLLVARQLSKRASEGFDFDGWKRQMGARHGTSEESPWMKEFRMDMAKARKPASASKPVSPPRPPALSRLLAKKAELEKQANPFARVGRMVARPFQSAARSIRAGMPGATVPPTPAAARAPTAATATPAAAPAGAPPPAAAPQPPPAAAPQPPPAAAPAAAEGATAGATKSPKQRGFWDRRRMAKRVRRRHEADAAKQEGSNIDIGGWAGDLADKVLGEGGRKMVSGWANKLVDHGLSRVGGAGGAAPAAAAEQPGFLTRALNNPLGQMAMWGVGIPMIQNMMAPSPPPQPAYY